MGEKNNFFKTVCNLAVPVTLQSMLQSSFSIVDQIMIGQLGSISVAGVGLAGKFASIYSVVVSAIGAVAGIMISQYLGQKNTAKPMVLRCFGTPERIRTAGLPLRRRTLYPAELRTRWAKTIKFGATGQ